MTNITSLYKRHKIIYTDPVPGKFNNIRILSMSLMTLFFFLIPWLKCDGRNAFIFDLSSIRFYFFKFIFWPQDFIFFAILLIILVLLLFAITVYSGRIWCGFLCPQSIWIRMVNFITRFIEGNKNKRFKTDNGNYTYNNLYKKLFKHLIFISLSFITAITFVSYFTPITKIIYDILSLSIKTWSIFWTLFFTILTYFNIAWFKEQFCFLACPYARLQSVMFDENTLIITYDQKRGEKRGHRNKNDDYKSKDLGDCIDCKKCVTCCPTGIDIRDGLQIECISCGACIDACDSVMNKMGYEKGLIKYTREAKNKIKFNIRFIAYIFIIFVLIFIFLYGLSKRELVQLNITRNQMQLYSITKDNHIENFYLLKIINKTNKTNKYKISLCEKDFIYHGLNVIVLNSEETLLLDIKVISIKKNNAAFEEISFKVENIEKRTDFTIKKNKFISPR